MVITNRKDLVRSGIFGDLEYELKKSLKIDDELEHAYHNWDVLDSLEKTRIKSLLYTEKEVKTHPHYRLLVEHIEHDEQARERA